MKRHGKGLILLLFSVLLASSRVHAGAEAIPGIQAMDAWDVLRHVALKQNLVLQPKATADTSRESQYKEFFVGKKCFRLRYRFTYSPSLKTFTLNLAEVQVHSGDTWKRADKKGTQSATIQLTNLADEIREGAQIIATKRDSAQNRPAGIDLKSKLFEDYDVLPDFSCARAVPFDDDTDYEFSEGMCAVRNGQRWGFLDSSGKIALDFRYRNPYGRKMRFKEGLCTVWPDSDTPSETGIVIGPDGLQAFDSRRYHSITFFSGGIALAEKTDENGKQVVVLVGHNGQPLPKGVVSGGFKRGIIEFKGFSGGLTPLYNPEMDGWGYIDTTGQWAIRPNVRYESAAPFSEGLAFVYDKYARSWGAIDVHGALVIPYMFAEKPGEFSEGIAAFRSENGKIGYMDKQGKVLIAPKYDAFSSGAGCPFIQGNALVLKDGEILTIDPSGQEFRLNGGRRDDFRIMQNGLVAFREWHDGRGWSTGVMRTNGEILLKPGVFFFVGEWNGGLAYAKCKIAGKDYSGFINSKGDFAIVRLNP